MLCSQSRQILDTNKTERDVPDLPQCWPFVQERHGELHLVQLRVVLSLKYMYVYLNVCNHVPIMLYFTVLTFKGKERKVKQEKHIFSFLMLQVTD